MKLFSSSCFKGDEAVQVGSNVQIETEHFILATQNRTEQLLLLRQSEREKETRRKREGNEEDTR